MAQASSLHELRLPSTQDACATSLRRVCAVLLTCGLSSPGALFGARRPAAHPDRLPQRLFCDTLKDCSGAVGDASLPLRGRDPRPGRRSGSRTRVLWKGVDAVYSGSAIRMLTSERFCSEGENLPPQLLLTISDFAGRTFGTGLGAARHRQSAKLMTN